MRFSQTMGSHVMNYPHIAAALAEMKNVCLGVGLSRRARGSRAVLRAAMRWNVMAGLMVCEQVASQRALSPPTTLTSAHAEL